MFFVLCNRSTLHRSCSFAIKAYFESLEVIHKNEVFQQDTLLSLTKGDKLSCKSRRILYIKDWAVSRAHDPDQYQTRPARPLMATFSASCDEAKDMKRPVTRGHGMCRNTSPRVTFCHEAASGHLFQGIGLHPGPKDADHHQT